MVEDKSNFVKRFQKLIKNHTSEYSDIENIVYVVDKDNNEWIYVIYKSDSQKRINVNADSCSAIMDDFLARLHEMDWLSRDEFVEPDDTPYDFFDEIEREFVPEDFTGHIGVLLDESANENDKKAAKEFLNELYKKAVKWL